MERPNLEESGQGPKPNWLVLKVPVGKSVYIGEQIRVELGSYGQKLAVLIVEIDGTAQRFNLEKSGIISIDIEGQPPVGVLYSERQPAGGGLTIGFHAPGKRIDREKFVRDERRPQVSDRG